MLGTFMGMMKEELCELSVDLTEPQLYQFYKYYELLVEYNKVMNLTAIIELDEVVTKHFIDSLALIKAVPELGNAESYILDLGTGAGFPGIPLKIAFPNLKVTLLDSLNKRIKFLNEVIEQLGLKEIITIHGRAEDYGRDKEYREQYDYCLSRAVANLSTLAEYCMPYVKLGGSFIAYKSGRIDVELQEAKRAVKLLGGSLDNTITFMLPKTDVQRSLVIIRKIEGTSRKYPRKVGLPSKEPLK